MEQHPYSDDCDCTRCYAKRAIEILRERQTGRDAEGRSPYDQEYDRNEEQDAPMSTQERAEVAMLQHRVDQLDALGFEKDVAVRIAVDFSIPIHDVVELVEKKGCPATALAYEILR